MELTNLNWNELEPYFCAAANHLEDIFNQTIKICDLYEQLNQEVARTCERDDQLFSKTQESLGTLNLINSVSDPGSIPIDVLARATQIFMRAQYMLAVISRIVAVIEGSPVQQAPAIPLHSKVQYH